MRQILTKDGSKDRIQEEMFSTEDIIKYMNTTDETTKFNAEAHIQYFNEIFPFLANRFKNVAYA